MKIKATKLFTFDAAHMLTDHAGLCKNLHGHTYKVEVAVELEEMDRLNAQNMVVDFKDLKQLLDEHIFSQMDHAYIYNSKGGAAERQIAQLLQSLGMRTFDMACPPTAENIAVFIYNLCNISLLKVIDGYLAVKEVTVWETPTSFATAYGQ